MHEYSRCCRGAPQVLCTNSTQFLYTQSQNLTFNNCISCCSAKSLHSTPLHSTPHNSTLSGRYSSPGLPSCSFCDEDTQPHSNHSKVISVTTNKTHTHIYNSNHKPFTKCGSSKHTQQEATDRQFQYKLNTELRSCNHCCRRKAGSITHSECMSVALLNKHAKHLDLPNFSHYLINGTI